MKIARNLAVSGWHVEWYAPLPAPSLRELLSAAKLRECTPMNVTLKNYRVYNGRWVNRWHGGTIGRHSLSQPLRAASSLREGAGVACTIQPGTR